MTYRYTNRATAQLAQSITPRDTIITLIPGTGDAFPALQQPTDRFALTLTSVSNPDQFEVCIVIGRQGDRVTVIRGQDNTTAQSFSSGDVASLNMTAGVYALFPQAGYMGVFDPTIANTINGYQKNAIVCDPDTAGLLWVSTKDGNKSSPSDQDGAWIHLTAGGNYADAGALDTEKQERQASEEELQKTLAALQKELTRYQLKGDYVLSSAFQDAIAALQEELSNYQKRGNYITSNPDAKDAQISSAGIDLTSSLSDALWMTYKTPDGTQRFYHAANAETVYNAATLTSVYTSGWLPTPPDWATRLHVIGVGAGGGGATCQADPNAQYTNNTGGGGGAGAYVEGIYNVTPTSTLYVSIGKGGTSEKDGEITTLSINGEIVLKADSGKASTWQAPGASAGGVGGYSNIGNSLIVPGGYGADGYAIGGSGASGPYGGEGRGGKHGGVNAPGFGSGGGGAYDPQQTNTLFQGGTGGNGLIRYRFLP